ncbi:MAG: DUF3280 domain-containing protein [Methylocystis sp.]|uniref:DUF3280 domain-containing protein n=1 Tax=Methylocystis sp. TaxID=1911079 RepID=UPI003D0B609E
MRTTGKKTRLRIVMSALIAIMIAGAAQAQSSPLLKLAVFGIELDDFTAGGPIAGESPEETARLERMTALARELLAQSGLFEIVDGSVSTDQNVKDHWLRKCNGCDADIARDLGADLSFVGFFRKVSVMEQYLELRIRDARTGGLVHVSQTDLRGETDQSWSRALKFLIRYQLVEPELARHNRPAQP